MTLDRMASLGSAPTTLSTSMPFAKNRSVGIAVMLKLVAYPGVEIDVAFAEGHPAGKITRKVLDHRGSPSDRGRTIPPRRR